jgi:hypothetical protein
MNNWRKGQTVFNFLAWLKDTGRYEGIDNSRMADPFYIIDAEWDRWWGQFIYEHPNARRFKEVTDV